MEQVLTLKRTKIGPVLTLQHIYIYMLPCAYLSPLFSAMSRNLRKRSAKWEKELEEGPES